MARQPRFVLVGQPQHVIQRGNNRSVIFVADEDYQKYMEILTEACERFECDVHAYVLMTNHVHSRHGCWVMTVLNKRLKL
jgi:putative transposase